MVPQAVASAAPRTTTAAAVSVVAKVAERLRLRLVGPVGQMRREPSPVKQEPMPTVVRVVERGLLAAVAARTTLHPWAAPQVMAAAAVAVGWAEAVAAVAPDLVGLVAAVRLLPVETTAVVEADSAVAVARASETVVAGQAVSAAAAGLVPQQCQGPAEAVDLAEAVARACPVEMVDSAEAEAGRSGRLRPLGEAAAMVVVWRRAQSVQREAAEWGPEARSLCTAAR